MTESLPDCLVAQAVQDVTVNKQKQDFYNYHFIKMFQKKCLLHKKIREKGVCLVDQGSNLCFYIEAITKLIFLVRGTE